MSLFDPVPISKDLHLEMITEQSILNLQKCLSYGNVYPQLPTPAPRTDVQFTTHAPYPATQKEYTNESKNNANC